MRTQARGNLARAKIYEAVSRRRRAGQASPTIREIATETQMSIATVHRHVKILTDQGLLKGKGRTLRPEWAS